MLFLKKHLHCSQWKRNLMKFNEHKLFCFVLFVINSSSNKRTRRLLTPSASHCVRKKTIPIESREWKKLPRYIYIFMLRWKMSLPFYLGMRNCCCCMWRPPDCRHLFFRQDKTILANIVAATAATAHKQIFGFWITIPPTPLHFCWFHQK
jgi:hypothetical protein